MSLPALPVGSVEAPDWDQDPVAWACWYLSTNGHLYRAFRRLADAGLAAAPHARLSADQLLHVIRWQARLRARGDLVAINDHASALFARLYLEEHPERERVFVRRRSLFDDLTDEQWARLMIAFEPLRRRRSR